MIRLSDYQIIIFKEFDDLKDELTKLQDVSGKEHGIRLRLEHELKEVKEENDEINEKRRRLELEIKKLNTVNGEHRKEISQLKKDNIELTKKEDDMNWINAFHLLKLLDDNNVKILDKHRTLRITKKGVEVTNNEGKESSLTAETIVVALDMKSVNEDFEEALKDKVPEVIAIGDCIKPRRVMNAIWEGYRKARIV